MRRLLILLLMLLLCIAPAYAAEDVFTVNAQDVTEDAWNESYIASSLTSDRSYLRVTCPLEEDAAVTMSIADESGRLVYQRDYSVCSGKFRSEDIYLRLTGSQTTYHVSLWVGDAGYSFPLRRVMPRLTGSAACTAGLPLAEISGADTWKTATVLDIAEVSRRPVTVALNAGDAYEIGTATFTVKDGRLKVSVALDDGVDGSIDKATVYVATTAIEAEKLGKKNFPGATAGLDEYVPLWDTPYAAVYVNLTVSLDPAGAAESRSLDKETQEEQLLLWERMLLETANEAVG